MLVSHVKRDTNIDGVLTKRQRALNPRGPFMIPRSLDGFSRALRASAEYMCHQGPNHDLQCLVPEETAVNFIPLPHLEAKSQEKAELPYRRTLLAPGKRKESLMKARKIYFAENVNYQTTEEKYREDKTRRSKRFERTQKRENCQEVCSVPGGARDWWGPGLWGLGNHEVVVGKAPPKSS